MREFPPNFVWGAATSAYQVEGSWNVDGRGESIWDRFCHVTGGVERHEDGDIACDHYRRYPEDIALMRELGLRSYRFSIAWPRVFPLGDGALNQQGLDHYRRVTDALLEAGIDPWVTLYHWDLPQSLEDRGGWAERETAERFGAYADVVARAIGDRVRHWITINEPWMIAYCGYRWGTHPPAIRHEQMAFAAAYHLLYAHGLGYEAIKAHRSNAHVGIANFSYNAHFLSKTQANESERAQLDVEHNAVFLDPVVLGTYPDDLLRRLGRRAPEVRPDDLRVMNRYDFLGVQYYKDEIQPSGRSGRLDCFDYTETGWPITPVGLREHLTWLHQRYQPKELVVTENGSAWNDVLLHNGQVRDPERQRYLFLHLEQVHRAIEAGVPITGYFVWSLLDNFEWTSGYRPRFGLIYTDYATQKRYVKDSGYRFAEIIRTNRIE